MNAIIRTAARHPLAMALTATFCYAIMSTLVKYVSTSYSTGEILVFRGLFGMLPPLIYVQLTASWGRLRGGTSWPHALRALAGMTAQGLSYAALALVPLSTASALGYASPIFVLLFGALLFHERIRFHSAAAIVVGIAGILLIVRPHGGLASGVTLGLTGSAVMALTTLSVRFFPNKEDSLNMSMRYAGFSALFALPLLFLDFNWPSPGDLLLLAGVGIFGGLGQILLILAHRSGSAGLLAPADFSAMIWILILQSLVFGQFPDFFTYCGVLLLIGCGGLVARGRTAASR